MEKYPPPTPNDQPPPGGFCDVCGHYALRHDETGCGGVTDPPGCKYGKGATKKKPKPCKVMVWDGVKWPHPWVLTGYDEESWQKRQLQKEAQARAMSNND